MTRFYKALFISIPDWGTAYDYDNKVFMKSNAKEALDFYRKLKKVTKYKVMFRKVSAFYQEGRLTWLPIKL